jgi:hypothetical protein
LESRTVLPVGHAKVDAPAVEFSLQVGLAHAAASCAAQTARRRSPAAEFSLQVGLAGLIPAEGTGIGAPLVALAWKQQGVKKLVHLPLLVARSGLRHRLAATSMKRRRAAATPAYLYLWRWRRSRARSRI